MMKKTYIIPTTVTVNIGMQHVMAASGLSFSDDEGSGFLNDDSADEGVEALSRGLFDF